MDKRTELKIKMTEKIREWRSHVDKAEAEKRDLTDFENEECMRLDAEVGMLKEALDAAERANGNRQSLEKLEQWAGQSADNRNMWPSGVAGTGGAFPGQFPGNVRANLDDAGFKGGVGEFLHALAMMKSTGARDERLSRLEVRDQQMGVGATGGFNLAPSFDPVLRFIEPDQAIFRPRCTLVGGNPAAPSSPTALPALDQTSSGSIYGGVIITSGAESVTIQEAQAKFREVVLEPHQKSAVIPITNKLLYNWQGSGGVISDLLLKAMVGSEEMDFMVGNGINRSLGAYVSACAITYTRATPGTIAFSDVVGMLARVLRRPGDDLVWVCSPTCIPALCTMVDAGNHSVFLGGALSNAAAGAIPTGLLGVPIMYSERSPALGTKGDLALLSLRYYLLKQGLQTMAMSTDVLFLSDRTCFRIVWEIDGRPWLTEPLALEGAPGSTVSPFVILSA